MNKKQKALHALSVRILGKDYVIAWPEGEEKELIRSAHYVDNKMQLIRSSGKVMGTDRIAVMAALNIAHEMLNANASEDRETLKKLKTLEQNINQAVERFQKTK
jgi:cell division protein ZapA